MSKLIPRIVKFIGLSCVLLFTAKSITVTVAILHENISQETNSPGHALLLITASNSRFISVNSRSDLNIKRVAKLDFN